MSNAVFVDTTAWIAVMYARDPLQPKALRLFDEIEEQRRELVTTSHIITEVLDGFAAHKLRHLSTPFRSRLGEIPRLEIVHVDEELFNRAWDFYEARSDKEWSLTDCLSFVVMNDRAMTDALAHDHHFEQAGFRAWLRGEI